MSPEINKPPFDAGPVIYEIKEGILYIERKARTIYTEEIMKGNVARRIAYTGTIAYPCIIYGKDLLSMDKGARGTWQVKVPGMFYRGRLW